MTTAGSTSSSAATGGDGGTGGEGGTGGFSQVGGGGTCGCAPGPHNDVVYMVSDDGEIWSFNPLDNDVSYVRSLLCAGSGGPFSMAVDQQGRAHVLASESNLILTFDLSESQGCDVAPYTPKQAAYDLFGMAFAGPSETCPVIDTFS